MRRTFKKLCVLMALIIMIGVVFAGCSSKTNDTPIEATVEKTEAVPASTEEATKVELEEVKLIMYLMGDSTPDVPVVYEEVNKMLKNDINATVEPKFFTWSDYENKYNLLISSGEEYDLIYAANWTNFADYSRRGAFLEITDEMLAKNAPETAKYPKDVLLSGKVDGKLYALPALKKEFQTLTYVVRGDLMKKYNIADIKTLDDFGVYLDAIAKNEKGMIPYDTNGDDWMLGSIFTASMGWKGIGQGAHVKVNDPLQKAFGFIEQPETVDFYKKIRDWQEKGYWSKNALSNKTQVKDSFEAGKSASAIVNLSTANQMYLGLKDKHADWDVKVYNAFSGTTTSVLTYMSNGMAINGKSKNSERALMLLDLFKNNEAYNVLLNYGIKDKNYTVNAEGNLEFPADNGYPPNGVCPWGWNNDAFVKPYAAAMPNYNDIMAEYENNYKEDPLREFKLDVTKISDIDTVLRDLNKQYGSVRALGFDKDIEKGIQTHIEKSKAAGYENYIKEVQAQIDVYLAEYNKQVK